MNTDKTYRQVFAKQYADALATQELHKLAIKRWNTSDYANRDYPWCRHGMLVNDCCICMHNPTPLKEARSRARAKWDNYLEALKFARSSPMWLPHSILIDLHNWANTQLD